MKPREACSIAAVNLNRGAEGNDSGGECPSARSGDKDQALPAASSGSSMAHGESCQRAPGGRPAGNFVVQVHECMRCSGTVIPEQPCAVMPNDGCAVKTLILVREPVVCRRCTGDIEVELRRVPPGSMIRVRGRSRNIDWGFWSAVVLYVALSAWIIWKLR